jgi:hypothetical protein
MISVACGASSAISFLSLYKELRADLTPFSVSLAVVNQNITTGFFSRITIFTIFPEGQHCGSICLKRKVSLGRIPQGIRSACLFDCTLHSNAAEFTFDVIKKRDKLPTAIDSCLQRLTASNSRRKPSLSSS